MYYTPRDKKNAHTITQRLQIQQSVRNDVQIVVNDLSDVHIR